MPLSGTADRLTPLAGRRSLLLVLRHDATLLYIQAGFLIALTFAFGRAGVAPVRYAFIVGCAGIGFQAWRAGPAKHIEMSIILFAWAPFLRRIVDFTAGFEPSGVMLLGPMLGLLPPCIDLYHWLVTGRLHRNMRSLGPYALMGCCLLYSLTVSITDGALLPAAIQMSKLLPPMLYGMWFIARGAETPDVIGGAMRGFLLTMPLAGIYSVYQYFDPPPWDAYWLNMTGANSMGTAESEKLRVFGPMNSPASLAQFMLAAILLIGFSGRRWLYIPLCVPIFAGLMLSSVRTAWIGVVVGIAYCWLRGRTRRRAQLLTLWAMAAIGLILATTSFGGAAIERFSTLAAPGEDGSAQTRASDYWAIIDNADQLIGGLGIGGLGPFGDFEPRVVLIPTEAIDGVVIPAILLMGLVFGGLYMLGIVWACAEGLFAAQRSADPRLIAAGAIVLANAIALPLTGVTSGEFGVLFWAFIGTISAQTAQASGVARATLLPPPA